MISTPKPPAPPDPAETGAAQTSTNLQTAIANAQLGNIDTRTPYGSITYKQDPKQTLSITDQQGNMYDVPKYTSTETLSPKQKKLFNLYTRNQLGLGRFANSQINFLRDYLGEPFEGSNEEVESRIFDLGSRRLDPLLARQEDALRTRLSNQGLKAGDTAWNTEMELQNQSRNDAYNQLALQGRGQAFGEALQSRNQPISELTQLMYGSQPQSPQQGSFNAPNVPTVDYAGLVNENYNQRLAAWQTQQQNRSGLFGSLLGAAGQIGAALPWSDKRLKKNIKKVGNVNGHDIHEYHFKGQTKGDPKTLGVMAQDVEKTRPDAVMKDPETGFKKVNYGALFGAN